MAGFGDFSTIVCFLADCFLCFLLPYSCSFGLGLSHIPKIKSPSLTGDFAYSRQVHSAELPCNLYFNSGSWSEMCFNFCSVKIFQDFSFGSLPCPRDYLEACYLVSEHFEEVLFFFSQI